MLHNAVHLTTLRHSGHAATTQHDAVSMQSYTGISNITLCSTNRQRRSNY